MTTQIKLPLFLSDEQVQPDVAWFDSVPVKSEAAKQWWGFVDGV